jgi:hypothetical protein
VHALPAALAALRENSYFVADDDNDAVLDALCKRLALRGINCEADMPSE